MENMTNEEISAMLVDELGIIYTDCNRITIKKLLIKMAEWKEQQMIGRALKHLQDVYTQFDITDTSGYRIDFRFFKDEFEKAMKGE